MIAVFLYIDDDGLRVINFDNDAEANKFKSRFEGKFRGLTMEELALFTDGPQHAGGPNTIVSGGSLDAATITYSPLPDVIPPTNGEVYDEVMKTQRVLKAFALCINDGSIVPGSNVSGAALKSAIKAKM